MNQSREYQEQILPQSLDLERRVLAHMVMEPGAADRVSGLLEPETFFDSRHRLVYEAACSVWRSRLALDKNLLLDKLADDGVLPGLGGQDFLLDLVSAAVRGADYQAYARQLREYSVRRRVIAAGEEVVKVGFQPGISLDEVGSLAQTSILRALEGSSADVRVSRATDGLAELLGALQAAQAGDGHSAEQICTGFDAIDQMTGGFDEELMVAIIARPSIGKTSLGLQVAEQMAQRSQKPVLFISAEMSELQLQRRRLSRTARIDSRKIKAQQLTPQDWQAIAEHASELADSENLLICDGAGMTVERICAVARQVSLEHGGLAAVFIDHLHKIKRDRTNDVAELSRISNALADLRKELKTRVFPLVQLSRATEGRTNKRPTMSDIRGCGTIEEDADIVIGLYRDEYYNPDTADRGIAELIFLKHRDGPVGTVKLLFEKQFASFHNLEGGAS